LKTDPRGQFHCDAHAATSAPIPAANAYQDEKHEKKVVEAESFADCISHRAAANGCQTARLFYQKDNAQAAERDGPNQLKAKLRSGLGRRSYRADFEKTADAGNDPKSYFKNLFMESAFELRRFQN